MHVKNYVKQFQSMNQQQKGQIQKIFSNLNRSRKSLSKLYNKEKTTNVNTIRNKGLNKNYSQKISTNYDVQFHQNLFNTLYHHKNLNSINWQQKISNHSTKVNTMNNKLIFKINYVQNHRPRIKQKIISKVKEESILRTSGNQIKNQMKRSQKSHLFKKSYKNEKLRQFLLQNNTVDATQKEIDRKQINRHQTLPVRTSKSNLQNYREIQGNQGKSQKKYQSLKKKTQQIQKNQLPDYAINIMKPCKIQGVQLNKRPSTSIKPIIKDFAHRLYLKQSRFKRLTDQQIELNPERNIKTARQIRSSSSLKQNLRKLLKKQKDSSQFEPWGNTNHNEQQESLQIHY